MPWLSLKVRTTAEALEELETCFWGTGAVSVTMADAEDQPIFEPGPGEVPVWQSLFATALYEADADLEIVRQQLMAKGYETLEVTRIEDQAWERVWLDRFEPMCFGKRLWVCPTGHEVTQDNAVVMDLDPGLAFGTGTHGTTRMCLQWLDAHGKAGIEVMDYGAGSGILAIAALLLGADKAIALDNDPQALMASRSNAERNNVAEKISTCLPQDCPEQTFELVLANILAGPLIELAPRISALVAPGGDLVLSGIMVDQADSVLSAYSFPLIEQQTDDGWVCLHLRRPSE